MIMTLYFVGAFVTFYVFSQFRDTSSEPHDIFLNPNENVAIRCPIEMEPDGFPPVCKTEGAPQLVIKFKDQELPAQPHHHHDTTVLKAVTPEQSGLYQCYCKTSSGDLIEIDAFKLHIGELPEIKNIHCMIKNLEKLVCFWDLDEPLPANVKASLLAVGKSGAEKLECITTGNSNQKQCKYEDPDLIMYTNMTLLLETNVSGQFWNTAAHTINPYQIAEPGDNDEVSAKATTTSVALTITPNRALQSSAAPNLIYEINYRDPETNEELGFYGLIVEWVNEHQRWTGNKVNVSGLEEKTTYNFTIKSKFITADENNPLLWHTDYKIVETLGTAMSAVRGKKSIMLHFIPAKQFRLQKPIDLEYEIEYKDPWTNKTIVIDDISVEHTDVEGWKGNVVNLTGLEEDTSYNFTLRGRAKTADESDPMSWTVESKTFTIPPSVPDTPEVPPGLFASKKVGPKRDVYLFWKQLLPSQWNGPPEHLYRLRQGHKTAWTTNVPKMEFLEAEPEEEMVFKLWAKNKIGLSDESIITIPPASKLLEAPKAKKEYVGNGTFRVSWQPPEDIDVISYTIARCKDPYISLVDCGGYYNWKVVDNSSVSEDIYIKQLTSPNIKIDEVPFLIAVNSESSSSGLTVVKA